MILSQKKDTNAQKLSDHNTPWRWKSCPLMAGLSQQICDIHSDFTNTELSTGKDQWSSRLTVDGNYTVESLRKIIDVSPLSNTEMSVTWCKETPLKVICFNWRAAQECIPTASALINRGVHLTSPFCTSCIGEFEDSNHLLVQCPFTKATRDKIINWCGTSLPPSSNTKELVKSITKWGTCPR
ncbi:unnamed protein product [Lactuca virosa]|uniref:Reverse transcriptase zinc-binding domain-containing protein n=1 Tax=Lactuca virosa TaxID=75947 RepID=A0AAU9NNZ2_9ASTR|nr:unnamed protein product [Lactuca virosa]